jgi:FkbM family methyltransferase
VWDAGSNIGIFSLRAAQLGHSVVAFDISRKALALLKRSAEESGLAAISTVPRAFTVRRIRYAPPSSSEGENRVTAAPDGTGEQSVTYSEAAEAHGVPDLLKMDIEGMESEFLASADFRAWVMRNRVVWVVDLHRREAVAELWGDAPWRRLDESHYALNAG